MKAFGTYENGAILPKKRKKPTAEIHGFIVEKDSTENTLFMEHTRYKLAKI